MSTGEGLARWLIQHAAHNAPPELSERLEEEWLADLEVRRGILARLRLAAGCCWATKVIAYEHAAASVAVAASTTGSKTMTAYAQHDDTFFSRRTVTVVAIVGLHVAIVYAFVSGLTHQVYQVLTGPTEYRFLPETKVDPVPPPQLSGAPPLTSTKVNIPSTDLRIDVPTDTERILDVSPGPAVIGPTSPPAPPRAVNRVLGGPGKGFPDTDDFYPADAIRKGLQGAAVVRTCVDQKGRLTAAPTVAKTSGTPSLDEGALRLARAGSGHYRATTEDGQPVSSCYEYRVTFHLKN